MKITENSSQEQELAVSFKTLALDIFKTLSLPNEDRGIDGLVNLNKIYNKYVNLVENSSILNQMNKKDNLLVTFLEPKAVAFEARRAKRQRLLDEEEITIAATFFGRATTLH